MVKSLFNYVADLKTCNFIKKRIQHRCFPGKFAKFLRTPILKNIGERLLLPLLKVHSSTALISPDQRYFQITTFSCFPRWAMPISNLEPEFSVDEANTELECHINHRATFTIILFDRLCPKNTKCKFSGYWTKKQK